MEDFIYNIDNLLTETEDAINSIYTLLFSPTIQIPPKFKKIINVQGIPILYSYWERFVSKSFGYYIDEINKARYSFDDFEDIIKINHFHGFKQLFDYPRVIGKQVKFFYQLNDYFSQSYHDLNRQIDTESNMKFKTLNKILKTLKLPEFSEYWDIYQHPTSLKISLDTFVDDRNNIAHLAELSNENRVTENAYKEYRTLIMKLSDEISYRMIDSLESKTFLKAS